MVELDLGFLQAHGAGLQGPKKGVVVYRHWFWNSVRAVLLDSYLRDVRTILWMSRFLVTFKHGVGLQGQLKSGGRLAACS